MIALLLSLVEYKHNRLGFRYLKEYSKSMDLTPGAQQEEGEEECFKFEGHLLYVMNS